MPTNITCVCPTCGAEHDKKVEVKSVIEDVLCPECGMKMVSRTGQYGIFWGCKQYPKCKGTRDSMGRSKAERDAEKAAKGDESSDWRDKDSTITSFNKK